MTEVERLRTLEKAVTGESRFQVGGLSVHPRERLIATTSGRATVEPLVMQLLVALSRRAGQLVTRREIFDVCWGSAAVGDDSLNRIVAVLRKTVQGLAGSTVKIDTVPGAGYILRLASDARGEGEPASNLPTAIEKAYDSWRAGLPQPDHILLETMRRECGLHPTSAQAWGMLALLCRHAAEYAEPGEVSAHVVECESSARRALALEAAQPEALVALASVAPLFGRWGDARQRLETILKANPNHAVAAHDLAMVEMATGRVRAAKAIMDGLLALDPLAACYCYKSMYQHWSVGDLTGLDHVADRAMHLWPTHPAVWTARLWTLAYTGRAEAALEMLADKAVRPNVPMPALAFFRHVIGSVVNSAPEQIESAVAASRRIAAAGPAQAIASLFGLGLLNASDDAFEVAEAYYLRKGSVPVPLRHTVGELSVNEQHRRVTQILFTPVFASMRTDPRFRSLCEHIGLSNYWEISGLNPDFCP